jgi:hypothetical protein
VTTKRRPSLEDSNHQEICKLAVKSVLTNQSYNGYRHVMKSLNKYSFKSSHEISTTKVNISLVRALQGTRERSDSGQQPFGRSCDRRYRPVRHRQLCCDRERAKFLHNNRSTTRLSHGREPHFFTSSVASRFRWNKSKH